MDDRELGRTLLRIARDSIGERFGADCAGELAHRRLDEPGATFVTLRREDALRGCIGSLEPVRALRADVAHNAANAAFADPRFMPLRRHELPHIGIEVSLLSATEPMLFGSEEDLLAQLVPGRDGLVLQYGRRRGTFLPQVWEVLADPREFLAELKGKAGLPTDFWSAQIEVARYSVTKWTEGEFAGSDENDDASLPAASPRRSINLT